MCYYLFSETKTLFYLSFGSATIISLILAVVFSQRIIELQNRQDKFKVINVIDGDSFLIPPEQSIRLDYLNAPELEYCYGNKAKEKLEELILNKYVSLKDTSIDSFKRTMASVYLDGKFVNKIMVEQGYAKYQRSSGGEKRDLIKQLSRQAKEEKRGVWSDQCYQKQNLKNPDCQIKGNISKSDGDKTYHFSGCSEYERTVVELDIGEQWFCSEKDAQQAGYTKSKHCFDKKYEN